MRRVITVLALIYLVALLLVFIDDDARSSVLACGAPTPTPTSGPPTPTMIPPTASPEVQPTIDLSAINRGNAPANLHVIAACGQDGQVRALLALFLELFEGWKLAPFDVGLPPHVTILLFEHETSAERRTGLAIYDAEGHAGRSVARAYPGQANPGANIQRDGDLVWMEYERDGHYFVEWGAVGGERRFTASATDQNDVWLLIDTLARAAEHACYPGCP